MSLSQTALRLAAVEALAPFAQMGAAAPVWPTFARDRVLDSQIAPQALGALGPSLPVIVVSTDAGKTEPRGTAQDVTFAGDGRETATLAFEIMVPVKVRDGETETVAIVGPTDAFAKATLDLLAAQILQRLGDERMGGALRHVLLTIDRVELQPYSDPDTDILLSATRMELTCHIWQQERFPAPPQTGLARLPQPLRAVAEALPEGSYGRTVCEGLAELIGDPAIFPTLSELRLAGNLLRRAGDAPAAEPDPTETPPTGDVAGRVTFP